jgi:radical SAM-linked protein
VEQGETEPNSRHPDAIDPQAEPSGASPEERCRILLLHTVEGDLRFISHNDTLRMWRRALVRAALPVRYSGGFNPQVRVNVPLPRPVGVASEAEALVVELVEPVEPEEVQRRLAEQVPEGIRFREVRLLAPRQRAQPAAVRYRFDLDQSPADLPARIDRLLQSDVVTVRRVTPKHRRGKTIDVRSYLLDLGLVEGAVEFTLRVTEGGTARPAEIAEVLGYDPAAIHHRICRMEIRWQ